MATWTKKSLTSHGILGAGLLLAAVTLAACGASAASAARVDRSSTSTPTTSTSTPTTSTSTPTTSTSTSTPSTTPTSSGDATGPVLLVKNYSGKTTFDGQKPASIDISPDSSDIVDHLDWSSWGPATATATGTLLVNGCNPNCASGTFHAAPATVTLGGVSAGHFTTLVVRSTNEVQRFTFPSDWVADASS